MSSKNKVKMMKLCGTAFMFLVILTQYGGAQYNSTIYCSKGGEQNGFYEASCKMNTTNERGIIAVKRVYYGAKPNNHLCESTDPPSVCCSNVDGQDCFFPNQPGELPPDVISSCSGHEYCLTQGKKKRTSSCPLPGLFSSSYFTTFGFMEYDCVNVGLLTDICHDGIIKTGEELYIASNIYHTNTEHSDKTCTCKMTTSCGASLKVDAVDVRLAMKSSMCIEELHIIDNKDGGTNKSVNCMENDLNAFAHIYTSQSNSANLELRINGNHTGKLWLKVSSTWTNATVQLRCGVTADLDTTEEHLCPEDIVTTPALTTTPTTTPTTTGITESTTKDELKCGLGTEDECSPPDSKDISGLPPGAIIGIIIAGVIILLIIILILVLIFKRNQKAADNPYEVPLPPTSDYETLRYNNLQPTPQKDNSAHVNPTFNHQDTEKPAIDRPTSDYEQLNHTSLPEYDNDLNESVMVMPNGAVMSNGAIM